MKTRKAVFISAIALITGFGAGMIWQMLLNVLVSYPITNTSEEACMEAGGQWIKLPQIQNVYNCYNNEMGVLHRKYKIVYVREDD